MDEGEGEFFGTIDIVVLVIYFVGILATSFVAMCCSKRDTPKGYFLAGSTLWWLPIGASLFASNIGSEHFIGLSGSGAAVGIAMAAYEFNVIFFAPLMGWIFLPVYMALGIYTIPEYLQKRFGGRRIQGVISFLQLGLCIFTKISVNLYSGSLFIQTALHWNFWASIALMLGLSMICTIGGGLTAVIYTDTIQAVLMCAGGMVLAVFSLNEVGGLSELYRKYMDAIPEEIPANTTCGYPPADALQMLRDPNDNVIPWPGFIFGATMVSVWYWCTDQVIVQRALASKNLSHGQGGTMLCGILKILPFFIILLPGMVARVLYPNEIACSVPELCEEFCGIAAGCSNMAYPLLVTRLMPTGLRGLMTAVMLSALMSDLTSIFNSASSLFTMDIYPLCRPKSSDRELMIVGRCFVIVMVVISIIWVPIITGSNGAQLAVYIQTINGILAPPIAVIYLLGLFWSRANEKGAFWSMIIGLFASICRLALEFGFPEPTCGQVDNRPWILSRVHFMYFSIISSVLTAISMVIISLLTEKLPDWFIIRTVFWTRFDDTVRPDEKAEKADENQTEDIRMEPMGESITKVEIEVDKTSQEEENFFFKAFAWFCGFSLRAEEPSNHDEHDDMTSEERVANQVELLKQSKTTRIFLSFLFVGTFLACAFLLVFFSIPPDVVGII